MWWFGVRSGSSGGRRTPRSRRPPGEPLAVAGHHRRAPRLDRVELLELGAGARRPAGPRARSCCPRRPRCTCRPRPRKKAARFVPFSRAISARRATSGSATTRAPPSPQVTFFVSWKLRQPGVAERAEGASAPGGGEPLRRVLDHAQAAAAGEVEEGLHVGRDARVVHGEDRGRAGRDAPLDVRGVEARASSSSMSAKTGPSAHAQHGVGARDEGERRADDLLAGADARAPAGPARARACRRS